MGPWRTELGEWTGNRGPLRDKQAELQPRSCHKNSLTSILSLYDDSFDLNCWISIPGMSGGQNLGNCAKGNWIIDHPQLMKREAAVGVSKLEWFSSENHWEWFRNHSWEFSQKDDGSANSKRGEIFRYWIAKYDKCLLPGGKVCGTKLTYSVSQGLQRSSSS